MSKLLGVDYGEKRTGIALSDDEHKWAFPHSVLATTPELPQKIKELMKMEGVELVVVGRARTLSGELGPQAESAATFAASLNKLGIKTAFEDETGTTEKGKDDSHSAAVILQGYLDEIE